MEEEGTRNLVVIGNGFDLAHGLKTSYSDFLMHYFLDSMEKALNSKFGNATGMFDYEDVLFRVRVFCRADFESLKDSCESLEGIRDYVLDNRVSFKIEPLTPFSTSIYESNDRWVDIEGLYYRQIRIIYENNSIARTKNEKRKLFLKLNEGINHLKERLETYLEGHVKNNRAEKIMDDLFFARHLFSDNNRLFINDQMKEQGRHDFYFLDFNYTKTSKLYDLNVYQKKQLIKINHIHGEIGNPKNPIIFGYGDEKDKDYKGIEDLEVDEAFENIKSFGYLKNQNYQNLLGFLNGGNFNVVIIGHSCGLSDRTLLSTIFEHPDCEKIRVCFYENNGWNDFTNKTYQMSRHFENKKVFRERIINEKSYDRIPQYND